MDSILEPLAAILAITLPILIVYGLLELEELMRRRKQAARSRHFGRGGNTLPGKTEQ